MKITLTGYRWHDKARKDQRTIVARGSQSESELQHEIRKELGYKDKLTPQYARSV